MKLEFPSTTVRVDRLAKQYCSRELQMNSSQRTIFFGSGIGQCTVGCTLEEVSAEFPECSEDLTSSLESLGLELSLNDDETISCLHIYVNETVAGTLRQFNGRTEEGIGLNSSVAEVLEAYGEPVERCELSGITLSYLDKGTSFTFEDDSLKRISIYAATANTWPKEWKQVVQTGYSSWLAFCSDSWLEATPQAQATFAEFARHAELESHRLVPAFDSIGIKAYFGATAEDYMTGEHIFLTDISFDGKDVIGTLNSDATLRSDFKEGDRVEIPLEFVSDWFIVQDGCGTGGFNMENTLDDLSFELDSTAIDGIRESEPFTWFQHYQEKKTNPWAELLGRPICVECDHRSLLPDDLNDEGICSLCAGGGIRCECPNCNAPLFRFPDTPRECGKCRKPTQTDSGGLLAQLGRWFRRK